MYNTIVDDIQPTLHLKAVLEPTSDVVRYDTGWVLEVREIATLVTIYISLCTFQWTLYRYDVMGGRGDKGEH